MTTINLVMNGEVTKVKTIHCNDCKTNHEVPKVELLSYIRGEFECDCGKVIDLVEID